MKVVNTTTHVIHIVHIHREGKQTKHTPMALQPGEQFIDTDIINDLEQQSRWQELIDHGYIACTKGKANKVAPDVS